jgi:fatty acid desaturase
MMTSIERVHAVLNGETPDRVPMDLGARLPAEFIFLLISHVLFVIVCILTGMWFLPVLITLAPFYSGEFYAYYCGIHQHAGCEANHPDYRISCGDVRLGPLSTFLYWHMEYHMEHHMFAAIPCYNLKAFSQFAADQLPEKERAWSKLLQLHGISLKKYGDWQCWRDHFGLYKGI